jgi:hypothetical protein
MGSSGIWRPPQWQQPAMVMITVPPQPTPNSGQIVADPDVPGGAILQAPVNNQTTYVFDAVLELDHEQELETTNHPIQTGADISTHAYLMPAMLTMLIGMSDAMDSYANSTTASKSPYITPFTGNPSKSVSAYQQMLALQAARTPLTITTRLRTYTNMIVKAVSPREDYKTIAGLRMRVVFKQIFTASTTNVQSARPNTTDSTGLGTINSQQPDSTIPAQFDISSIPSDSGDPDTDMYNWLSNNPDGVDTPGAGSYSSVNINNLQSLPSP